MINFIKQIKIETVAEKSVESVAAPGAAGAQVDLCGPVDCPSTETAMPAMRVETETVEMRRSKSPGHRDRKRQQKWQSKQQVVDFTDSEVFTKTSREHDLRFKFEFCHPNLMVFVDDIFAGYFCLNDSGLLE